MTRIRALFLPLAPTLKIAGCAHTHRKTADQAEPRSTER